MVTVRAKRTTLGEYGILKKGQTTRLRDARAQQLVNAGIVEVIEDEDGIEDPESQIKGGIRIKDATGNTQATDDRVVIKKDKVVKIGPEPVAAVEDKMPENYAGKVVMTERGPAIMGQPGPELVKFPEGAVMPDADDHKVGPELVELPNGDDAEKAEPTKPEQAETAKAEPKETKKKEYK